MQAAKARGLLQSNYTLCFSTFLPSAKDEALLSSFEGMQYLVLLPAKMNSRSTADPSKFVIECPDLLPPLVFNVAT